jgi:hypothetical protein
VVSITMSTQSSDGVSAIVVVVVILSSTVGSRLAVQLWHMKSEAVIAAKNSVLWKLFIAVIFLVDWLLWLGTEIADEF